MKIEFEPFSRQAANSQAIDLRHLVRQEKNWLHKAQPAVVGAYMTRASSAERIKYLVRQGDKMQASIIRRGRAAVGVATLIAGQELIHPARGIYSGTSIDYWLQRSEDAFTHNLVAKKLIDACSEDIAMATVIQGHPSPPVGFKRWMAKVGEPALLTSGVEPDRFDVARTGRVVQLYIHPPELAAIDQFS